MTQDRRLDEIATRVARDNYYSQGDIEDVRWLLAAFHAARTAQQQAETQICRLQGELRGADDEITHQHQARHRAEAALALLRAAILTYSTSDHAGWSIDAVVALAKAHAQDSQRVDTVEATEAALVRGPEPWVAAASLDRLERCPSCGRVDALNSVTAAIRHCRACGVDVTPEVFVRKFEDDRRKP